MNYTLFELNEHLRRVVALNFSESLWLKAEIAQLSESRGHWYLDLVEKNTTTDAIIAQSKATIWANQYFQLRKKVGIVLDSILREGAEVQLLVRVEFHERYGLSFNIEDVDLEFSLGKLELQRQKTLAELKNLNLLDRQKQLKLPLVLQRLAVISSETAAGLQDFLHQLSTNNFLYVFDCQLFSSTMQGVNVEKDLIKALQYIDNFRDAFDAVVIIRGGGARLDLLAFDNLNIAKAVAKFSLPIIVGIGHETDETILDIVAHHSLKTPTAVADFVIHRAYYFESLLHEFATLLNDYTKTLFEEQRNILNDLTQIIDYQSNMYVKNEFKNIATLENELNIQAIKTLKKEEKELINIEKIIHILNPNEILKRGFSITYDEQGKIITTIRDVQANQNIVTKLADGNIKSIVG